MIDSTLSKNLYIMHLPDILKYQAIMQQIYIKSFYPL